MPPKANKLLDDWTDGLAVIGADLERIDEGPAEEDIEAELMEMVHLLDDPRFEDDAGIDHICRDARKVQDAREQIGRIPDAFECFHLLCRGTYALWDMVPAILELAAPNKITTLYIATLGFSKQNIAELCELIDAGAIGHVSLLCSHYFKGTSGGICETAKAEFEKRPNATRFLSIRTHCKILAVQLTDGRTITIESSANLRSCKNIEQMTLFGHPDVFDFHTAWMRDLFGRGCQ
jgi:hypothetical protein